MEVGQRAQIIPLTNINTVSAYPKLGSIQNIIKLLRKDACEKGLVERLYHLPFIDSLLRNRNIETRTLQKEILQIQI